MCRHNCWGIVINLPLVEVSSGKLKQWAEKYGCKLGLECPFYYCVHIDGVAGLDVENMKKFILTTNDNNRTDESDIVFEDIRQYHPPARMVEEETLHKWR